MSHSLSLLGVKGGPAIRPGSSMPTSMLLRLGGRTIVMDAGLGVTRAICDRGVPLTEIELVFVTHLHSDHYLELGPLIHTAWTAGLSRPVTIFGPPGVADYWRAFLASMAFDIAIRLEDEGRPALSDLVDFKMLSEGEVLSQHGLTVNALQKASMRWLHACQTAESGSASTSGMKPISPMHFEQIGSPEVRGPLDMPFQRDVMKKEVSRGPRPPHGWSS